MKAVVIGGTGAVGLELVGQLLNCTTFSSVTTIGRREVDVPAAYQGYNASKLVQKGINMDNLTTEGAQAFQDAHTVFCTLGTTRKVAGSAAQFRKVDLEYVKQAAQAAKQAGAQQFTLCSSKGANANIWANDFSLCHPLLYMKTKGQAEQAVQAENFPASSIFRPGKLARGSKANTVERLGAVLPITSTPVRDVARAMVLDAEANKTGMHMYNEATIMQIAKSGNLP